MLNPRPSPPLWPQPQGDAQEEDDEERAVHDEQHGAQASLPSGELTERPGEHGRVDRRRPRRACVGGLEREARQPRHEQQAAAAQRRQRESGVGPEPAPHRRDHEAGTEGGDEIQRPVVREQQRSGERTEADQPLFVGAAFSVPL